MAAVAMKRFDSTVVEEMAVVLGMTGESVQVRSAEAEYHAHRAVSCLVAPERGDQVLVAVAANGSAYVLAVLEREGRGACISVEGDLDLRSESGQVHLSGAEGVSVISPKTVSIVSDELHVRSLAARVVVDGLTILGKRVQTQIEQVKVAALSIDSVVERWYQRAKRSYRVVEESDHLRAGSIDVAARDTMNVRARDAAIVAQDLVKVDGGQIQLG